MARGSAQMAIRRRQELRLRFVEASPHHGATTRIDCRVPGRSNNAAFRRAGIAHDQRSLPVFRQGRDDRYVGLGGRAGQVGSNTLHRNQSQRSHHTAGVADQAHEGKYDKGAVSPERKTLSTRWRLIFEREA